MIHTIVHSLKKLAVPVAFLAFFMMFSANQASAQSLVMQSTANPEAKLAQKFGVTARSLGTWTPNNVVQILRANRPAVKDQSNAPLASRVTYAYYQLVISDIQSRSIAPEIALLTNLQKVQEQFKSSGVTENYSLLSSIYNSTVALF